MAALVVAAALLFQATLLCQPGLFSQDVFSYVAYGRLAAIYELNPYIWPPGAIAKDPVVSWVADVWRDYAAPYGPVWMGVQWLLAHLSGARPVPEQVLFYRGLASGLLLANLGLLGQCWVGSGWPNGAAASPRWPSWRGIPWSCSSSRATRTTMP